ncbi:MAG: tRNA (adenosine(37)-N6)-threonylcarbamoyltransferase complex dimerization subunit type 1 TsaB [Thermoleophilia bacterium]|nr:tRNA (adenosine(37)-N6)-threonylcarbamoyltransferase complex dimerization subunit type 1 TsaB [Thermoleophilia bacterium]
MTTFALDTSTTSPSLALARDDRVLAELWLAPAPEAGRRVLEAAHHLMAAAGVDVRDLTRIVVGVGPGGFTGLRIGLATALALGQALDAEVVGASSLEALAQGIADASGAQVVVPVTDARRREVFTAAYRVTPDGGLTEILPPAAVPVAQMPGHLAALGGDVAVAGTGAALLEDLPAGVRALPERSPGHRLPAGALVRRVAAGTGLPAAPVYARLPDAEVNRLRAVGTAGR